MTDWRDISEEDMDPEERAAAEREAEERERRERYDRVWNGGIREKWEYGEEELTLEDAHKIEENLDILVPGQMEEIDGVIEREDEPYEALGLFQRFVSFLNSAIQKLPNIIMTLSSLIKRMRRTMERLARKFGALSFSIGVSPPTGVSFSVSFDVSVP